MYNDRMELRLAGSGGQGVILASVILAEAAVLMGKNATQSQSYGPEARGGLCKAEDVISSGVIGFPKVQRPTFLLALTQQSLEKYSKELPEGCVVMADASLSLPIWLKETQVVRVPILRTAAETVGKSFTANIVAVGAINRLLGIASDEVLRQAVELHIPKGTEKINHLALEAGMNLLPSGEKKRRYA